MHTLYPHTPSLTSSGDYGQNVAVVVDIDRVVHLVQLSKAAHMTRLLVGLHDLARSQVPTPTRVNHSTNEQGQWGGGEVGGKGEDIQINIIE